MAIVNVVLFDLKFQEGGGGLSMRGLKLIMWSEGQWEASKKIPWEGDTQTHRHTDIATTRPNQPSGPIRWKLIFFL